jgi:hypothetical protein
MTAWTGATEEKWMIGNHAERMCGRIERLPRPRSYPDFTSISSRFPCSNQREQGSENDHAAAFFNGLSN